MPNLSSWSWKAGLAGASRMAPLGGVTILHAVGSGDDTLIDVASHSSDQEVTLVTADRELRRRAESLGADVVGPGSLLEILEQ